MSDFAFKIDEPVYLLMIFGMGFLLAAALAIPVVAAVHKRAVRLTQAEMQKYIPAAMNEITADKDLLRAEFAVATHKMETTIHGFKDKVHDAAVRLSERESLIKKLKAEVDQYRSEFGTVTAREKAAREEMLKADEALQEKSTELHNLNRELADKASEIARLSASLQEGEARLLSQSNEIESLRIELDAIRVRDKVMRSIMGMTDLSEFRDAPSEQQRPSLPLQQEGANA